MLRHSHAGWQRAHAMQAFPWNESTRGSTAQRAGRQPAALDVLCPICSSPLTDAEIKEACQTAVRCLPLLPAATCAGNLRKWQLNALAERTAISAVLSIDLLFVAPCLALCATAYMLACCVR